jgi:alkaline phosphatase
MSCKGLTDRQLAHTASESKWLCLVKKPFSLNFEKYIMKNHSNSTSTANRSSFWQPTRRDFLKASAGLLAATALAPFSCCPPRLFNPPVSHRARFGMVTDIHYADTETRGSRHYRESTGKLNECVELMNQEKVDFLIELGDFKDQDEPPMESLTLRYLRTIEETFAKFPGPRYHVLGNHDMDSLSKNQFLRIVKNTGIDPKSTYYSFDKNGVHFIVLDANFTSRGAPYRRGNFDWTDANISPAQLDWLRDDLKTATGPTIVFTHQLLDGTGDVYVNNAPQVRKLLQDSGKVLAVFQGHHHEGSYNLINGIHYYTLKALVEGPAPDNNSYAIVEVLPNNHITVTGYRKALSKKLIVSNATPEPEITANVQL